MEEKNKSGETIASFLAEDDILIRQGRISRDEAIHRIVAHLASAHSLPDPDKIEKAIFERESRGDTVVADGVALPHARLDSIQRPYIAVLTSEKGVPFALDKPLVNLVILLLTPVAQPAVHLQILKAIAEALRVPQAVQTVVSLRTAPDVFAFFARKEHAVSGQLEAQDIMDPAVETLNESDSLKTAIDRFIALNTHVLPVIDRYGTMTGVVTIAALLRVCIPDYLLWMHDLSPMVNFEPFADMLKNEQNSSITDIINKDFAGVQKDAPAISVAAEFVRRNASTCYVLDGTKLAGVITLPFFLNKLFRE